MHDAVPLLVPLLGSPDASLQKCAALAVSSIASYDEISRRGTISIKSENRRTKY
jgi:hypothetical protein